MVRLLPENLLAAFSDYEISLLLLSAYLHDIGMTPEVNKVRRHRDFLLTGDTGLLSDDEGTRFQEWMDAAGYGITPPLEGSRALDQTVRLADEIITYYTRHRHNDWSEEWIRAHFEREPMGNYQGWMTDLIRLCRSHHEGYDVLAGREFDPRRVGSRAEVVHLRYLAALLRVADVLDVDRERTPEVIFHHRAIADASQTYWQKDAELTIYLEDGQLSAHARPPRAYLHRAVEETIDGIERELALCRRLADTTRFEKPVGPGADFPHKWTLSPTVFRDVEPRDGAYQYIDGAFRPNTRRLLELLSGTALYGDPLAAIREVLQNAFDAVRELIAYRRLHLPNPSDPEAAASIAQSLWVRLSLEQHENRLWLVCRDGGIGMTREIIRDALLVSGSPVRPQVLNLERRCRAAGFQLGRTGQFGIGALSYFMIADSVMLTTRRANEASDAEQNGWWFESSGVGSFGELRPDSSMPYGTELRMRLRSEVATDPAEFAARLAHYIRTALVHIPCNLEFDAPLAPNLSFRSIVGWTLNEEGRTAAVLQDFHPSGEETGYAIPKVQSSGYMHRMHRHAQRWREIRQSVMNSLRWETEEGALPGGVGRYRLHLPYFDVPGGFTLAFIRPRQETNGLILRHVAGGHYEIPGAMTVWAWKGIQVQVSTARVLDEQIQPGPFGVLIRADALVGQSEVVPELGYSVSAEVDFHSPEVGTLSVSRGHLDLNQHGKAVVRWLRHRAGKLVGTFVSTHQESAYSLLNARVSGVTVSAERLFQWAQPSPHSVLRSETQRALRWGPLRFPLTPFSIFAHSSDQPFSWNGHPVSVAVSLRGRGYDWSRREISWYDRERPPQRVVAVMRSNSGPVPTALWTDLPLPASRILPLGWSSNFPPEWRHICAADLGAVGLQPVTWNMGNPVVQAALGAPESQWWDASSLENFSDTLEEVLDSPASGAAWVLNRALELLTTAHVERAGGAWRHVQRANPDFLPRLWTLLFENPIDAEGKWYPLTLFRARVGTSEFVTLTPDGVGSVQVEPGIRELTLPRDSGWVVTEIRPPLS